MRARGKGWDLNRGGLGPNRMGGWWDEGGVEKVGKRRPSVLRLLHLCVKI